MTRSVRVLGGPSQLARRVFAVAASVAIAATTAAHTMWSDDTEPGPAVDAAEVRFVSVDVTIDPAGARLAAYQVSIPKLPGVTLVGVAGGEVGSVFAEPPAYDAAALAGGTAGGDREGSEAGEAHATPMIVLAAFSLDGSIDGPTHVAELQLHVEGDAALDLVGTVLAAGSPSGERLSGVTVTVGGVTRGESSDAD